MKDAYLNRLLGERETVLLIAHQHWFRLLQSILVEIILAILTVVFVSILWVVWAGNPLVATGYLLLLIPLASTARDFILWYNHKYVVTNRRVIQVFGVINKNITDSSLEKVNDVKMDQSFWGRLFDFGDVEILTASELGVNRFTTIGNPIRFKTIMLNAKLKLEDSDSGIAGHSNIPALIQQLDQFRKEGILTEEEFSTKKAELLARL
ncbi:MAG: PH domain-containing protein [Anaerolineaceae bacterium]|nr:PH domain-containing protein [Anaerolineaceae bacterium]